MSPAILQDLFMFGMFAGLAFLAWQAEREAVRVADTRAQLYSAIDRIAKADTLDQLRADMRRGWPELFDAERGQL